MPSTAPHRTTRVRHREVEGAPRCPSRLSLFPGLGGRVRATPRMPAVPGPADGTEGGDEGGISTSGLPAVRLRLPRGYGGLPGARGTPARSRAALGEGAQAGEARDRERRGSRGGGPVLPPGG